MSHIFISYSKYDHLQARHLAEVIRNSGFDVWIDDHIDYGHQWWQKIVEGINNCAVFVILMTPNSEKSEWIEREILVAQRQEKPIIPLLLSGQVFPLLITSQYVDITDEKHLPDEFYIRLKQFLASEQPQGLYVVPSHDVPIVENPQSEFPNLKRLILMGIVVMLGVIAFAYLRGELEDNIPHIIVRSYPNWEPREHEFLDVEMVLVPAGCFINRMLHSHCFESTFWIDKYEVTQATFERLGGVKLYESVWQGDHLPVTNITAEEALLFCQIRGGRLPHSVEWEYATLSRAGRIHALAAQIDPSKIVAAHTADNQPAQVGKYPENASWVGALDLIGNVWEWTMTDSHYYVLQGGSWRSLPNKISIASTMAVIPDFTSDDAGFRCVIEG